MYKIMTPGPTQVAENVRLARSRECTNPDLDENFVEFYKETCEEISHLLHTDNETLILGGEGILGLEAACASMTEPGDRVLVLNNGIYGTVTEVKDKTYMVEIADKVVVEALKSGVAEVVGTAAPAEKK